YVAVTVSDSGIGMDKKTMAQAFDPFFTTKEQGKGTGLGLSTVYGIVSQSGGHIWLYSEPGTGTTFKVYLPIVEEAAEAQKAAPANVTLARGSETILLVEDEPMVRDLASLVLRDQGFTLLEARNGEEAIKLAANHQGKIHLLLTDVVMPGIGGRELSERIKAARPDIKVLYYSGYTDDAIVQHGMVDAGTPFLEKPFTRAGLLLKVREVLDSAKDKPMGSYHNESN
ncbi:MAG: response regulator, partial [Blastocatellia bacterium]